jgi:uncharacterized protein (TIGR04255 family)
MGRKYANPPIIEAICEFRLSPQTQWDLTVPGLLYERLKQEFPHKEQRVLQEVELTQSPEVIQQQIRTGERLLFFTEGKRMLVQVGTRLLAVHALAPYPNWEGFKPRIETSFKSLQDTVEIHGLERISLHYINRVKIPTQCPKLNEYLEFYPFIGSRLPTDTISFLMGVEFSYADGRDRCRVQLAPTPSSEEGKTVFILELEYFLAHAGRVAAADALAWVEEAHSRVEEVFEGCITDNLRRLFEEVK